MAPLRNFVLATLTSGSAGMHRVGGQVDKEKKYFPQYDKLFGHPLRPEGEFILTKDACCGSERAASASAASLSLSFG